MNRFVLIALGAALGANARYLVGLWAGQQLGAGFPYGTLIVNVTGSFVLGFLFAATTGRLALSAELRLLLGVGFLGAFTTFSSFAVESLTLLQNGSAWKGVFNVLANDLVGLLAALLGLYLARLIAG